MSTASELSETDKALAKLTDDQRAKMDEYDSQTTEFIAELTSNVWTARNDSYFLTFTGVTFTDHAKGEDGTEATIHPYVVSDLITHAPTTADGKSTEVAEAVIETDEGSFVLKHTLVTDTETGKSTAKISTSCGRSTIWCPTRGAAPPVPPPTPAPWPTSVSA